MCFFLIDLKAASNFTFNWMKTELGMGKKSTYSFEIIFFRFLLKYKPKKYHWNGHIFTATLLVDIYGTIDFSIRFSKTHTNCPILTVSGGSNRE